MKIKRQYFASWLGGVEALEPIPPSLFSNDFGNRVFKNISDDHAEHHKDSEKCPWCKGLGNE